MKKILLAIASVLVGGGALLVCLFVYVTFSIFENSEPGFWVDDPKNWERAMGYEQPENVIVVHSQYWQSEHFSNEYEFFFKIQADASYKELLLSEGNVVEAEGLAIENLASPQKGNIPQWFVSGNAEQYNIYVFDYAPENFRVFIDKESGEIYLADSQY